MERIESQAAAAKLGQLKAQYQVEVQADWGFENPGEAGEWKGGSWMNSELDRLHDSISLLARAMGGNERFAHNLGGVTVRKADLGPHGGEALAHQVSLSTRGSFSAWTVVHEFAHAWDANHGWRLSRQLEKFTGGFTSPIRSVVIKLVGLADSGFFDLEDKPGRRGRRPGCNAAGYFYGDKPSGSNWRFNRIEDFAESVAMYIGWDRDNELSQHARNRIIRFQLQNGEKDFLNVSDNWVDYARYFFPPEGDYTRTRRWQFVDDLMNGRLGTV